MLTFTTAIPERVAASCSESIRPRSKGTPSVSQIARRDAGEEEPRLAARVHWPAGHLDLADAPAAIERDEVRGTGGDDAGQRFDAAQDVFDAPGLRVGLGIGARRA